jgi:chromosome segregation ATPase
MRAPRANTEMAVSQSPEKPAEPIAKPVAPTPATRRGRTEETSEGDPTRVTEARDAEARSLERSLKSLGDELGHTLAERTAAELRAERLADALAQLQVELTAAETSAERSADAVATVAAQLAESSAERERVRGEAAELRALMDHQASEWRIERAALATERDAVVAERLQHAEALDRVRAELAEARGHVARLEKHAAWAGEQLALLVETEAATAAELGRKQRELEVLNIRLDGLDAELRTKEADLSRREELFRARATRILGAEMPPTASALEALDVLHRHIREIERELDREAVARQRMAVVLNRFERSAYGTGLRVWRRLLEKCGLRRLVPRESRRP